MEYEEILSYVLDKVRELTPEKEVNENSDLVRDLGLDSLDIPELQLDLEDRIGIELDDKIFPQYDTRQIGSHENKTYSAKSYTIQELAKNISRATSQHQVI